MTRNSENIHPVSAEELRILNDALTARHGRALRPGEGIALEATRTKEEAIVKVVLSAVDDTLHLEVEAAILTDDEHKTEASAQDRLMVAADFADAMLDEYFANERVTRFHDDWRVYDFDGFIVRFRGQETNPSLDALADAWLSEHGEPDDQLS